MIPIPNNGGYPNFLRTLTKHQGPPWGVLGPARLWASFEAVRSHRAATSAFRSAPETGRREQGERRMKDLDRTELN
jgi:hypothetical protein